ncbi:MAG: hypothetical protein DRJ42_16875 [Deltaproteobacteria bacterium]|nr:MAG: hypothetical protein DRJ42_16875 [Deltaproteobacteria bacterium]
MTHDDLPPTDHVARVLMKTGARDAAVAFLRAAVARDPGEKACAALLLAVEARPDASVYGPDTHLSVSVARSYVRRGWLLEARAILSGTGLDESGKGRALALEIEEVLGPIPNDAAADLFEADQKLRTGGAAVALMIFDEYAATGRRLPAWAERRHQLLGVMLLDSPPVAAPSEDIRGMSQVGAALTDRLAARDIEGVLSAARTYAEKHPDSRDARAVVLALGRLVESMAVLAAAADAPGTHTQPMTGINVAIFQTRMCNFDIAERLFRKLVIEDTMDAKARSHLDDIQTIKKALGMVITPAKDVPPEPVSSPDVLAPAASAEASSPALLGPDLGAALDADVTKKYRNDPSILADESNSAETTAQVDMGSLQRHLDATRNPERPITVGDSSEDYTVDEGPDEFGFPRPIPTTASGTDKRLRPKAERTAPLGGTGGSVSGKRPITASNLLKKSAALSPNAWVDSSESSGGEPSWDEVSTEIGDPAQMAELLLKQGYAERALKIYRSLIAVQPKRSAYMRRMKEIEELIATGTVPRIATNSSVELPPDRPGPAAGSALDALAPSIDAAMAPTPAAPFDRPQTGERVIEPAPPIEMNTIQDELEGEEVTVVDFELPDADLGADASKGQSVDSPPETDAASAVVVRRVIAID